MNAKFQTISSSKSLEQNECKAPLYINDRQEQGKHLVEGMTGIDIGQIDALSGGHNQSSCRGA